MEAAAEAVHKEQRQSLTLKGKRTKRQRPLSPIPFSIVPPLSSHEPDDVEKDFTSLVSKENNDILINGAPNYSASSSTSQNKATLMDEEDQDMDNCLILLAQGHFLPHHNLNHQLLQTKQLMTSCQETGRRNNNSSNRFSSRRFLETSSLSSNGTTTTTNGYYVYQCKTCDRTFPSFQALGGHRASHKKPKASDHNLNKTNYDGPVSLCLSNVVSIPTPNNHRSLAVHGKSGANKFHECGLCGAQFTSGQALGGHMRRHRGALVPPAATIAVEAARANTALSLLPMSFDQMSDAPVHAPVKRARSAVVSLDLDLNLPAPEDENRVNGLTFGLKQEHELKHEQTEQQKKHREDQQEQKSLVISSVPPTLVDCFY